MKKIVVAADSFKGSISSGVFAEVCRKAVTSVLPDCEVLEVRLGDGGEGTSAALGSALGCRTVSVTVDDPLGRPVEAGYGLCGDNSVAVMEMAQASGLTLLKTDERNPLLTSTFGTGQMIRDALSRGCRKILLCIGGSATNDGGMGLLSALGVVFYDRYGRRIPGSGTGGDLDSVESIDLSGLDKRIVACEITVACDVDNPFCGPRGAAHVYARQKGADDQMIDRLERGMCHFADVVLRSTGVDVKSMPGAGAAGGVGGALAAVLGAKLMPGIDMVLDAVGFDDIIVGADLIITGEGKIDDQTLMGKTLSGVLSAGCRRSVPVVALAGSVDYTPKVCDAGFAGIFSIQPGPVDLQDALDPRNASRNLADTVVQLVRLLTQSW